MRSKETQEIKKLLEGNKTDEDVVRRLRNEDETLWKLLLSSVTEENLEIRFSRKLIGLLEINRKKWLFLRAYLSKIVNSTSISETIPLFDLSAFSGYLKFKRQVLGSGWQVDLATLPTAIACLILLMEYTENLNAMEKTGSLQTGKLIDEFRLFFQASSQSISKQMDEIRIRAEALGLT